MTTAANYGAIKSADQFEVFVDRLISDNTAFGFDIESGYYGPDKEKAALLPFYPDWVMVGFSFTNSLQWARYVPVAHDSGENIDDPVRVARLFWKLLQTGNGVAHNATFELKGLSRWFRDLLSDDPEVGEAVRESQGLFPVLSDTMIEIFMRAHKAPKPMGGPGLGLKENVYDEFGHQMTEFLSLFPEQDSDLGLGVKKAKQRFVRFNTRNLTPEVTNYGCEDSLWCLALHFENYPHVKDQLMFKTEILLMPVLVEMEIEGILLDWGKIAAKTKETAKFRDLMNEEILSDLSERLNENININLASVPQLSEVLYEKLGLPIKERSEKTDKPSTSESALRAIAKEDPVVRRILEYREVVKLYGSYLNKYDTELNYAGNDRAYPNHNQTGALTGRFSVDGVSYQQWPKPYHYELKDGTVFEMAFKDLLVAPKGFRIMGYDFSQVELRVLAGQADETTLLKAFAEGIDIHKQTAATMFKIELEAVTKGIRANGKTLNFAVVYGSGAQNIAEMLSTPEKPVTKDDAQELLDAYYAGFPKLKAWMDQKVLEGHEQGYVETMFGRKFTVWEYQSRNNYIRSKGDRMCVNAPIQGGAADYMKLGMVRVNRAIKAAEAEGRIIKGGIRLIMTIHDALEFYVHESVSSQLAIDIIQPQISFRVQGLPEIRADWHEGYRWGSVVEIKQDKHKQISGYGLEDVDEEFSSIDDAFRYIVSHYNKPISEVWPTAPEGMDHIPDNLGTIVNERAETEEVPEDDTPMVFSSDPEFTKAIVTLTDMPTTGNWPKLLSYLADRPGTLTVDVETPQGTVTLDGSYKLSKDDQPLLSLLMGGADLRLITTEAVDITAGITL